MSFLRRRPLRVCALVLAAAWVAEPLVVGPPRRLAPRRAAVAVAAKKAKKGPKGGAGAAAVSYTHLTLPTKA